jgi:hypothetical protein
MVGNVLRFLRHAELQRVWARGETGRAVREFFLSQMQERKDLALRRLQGQTKEIPVLGVRA